MNYVNIASWKGFLGAGVLGAALIACASSASATPTGTVYTDNTSVQAYYGSSANSYNGPGFSSTGVGDVLQDPGHGFNTDRVVVSLTKSGGETTLNLQYYTTFNGDDETARYADIFLGGNTIGPNNTTVPNANPNTFQYAISVGDEAANGGVNTVGFYALGSATSSSETSLGNASYETSQKVWSSNSGYIYGGAFQGTDGNFYASPTVVKSGDSLDTAFAADVAETSIGTTSNPYYLVDVTLSASNQNFNALFGNGLSVFWGTGDCSNDAVQISLTDPPRRVPEPMTLALFGAGLAGAAAVRGRKKTKAA